MNLQAYLDGMSIRWKKERGKTQMTLGKLIATLEGMPKKMKIEGITNPHSYRGYYEDLAFALDDKKITVSNVLKMCRSAMGKVFIGYKGGEFVMGELTPVWIAEYGECGKKIISIDDDGMFLKKDDDYDLENIYEE